MGKIPLTVVLLLPIEQATTHYRINDRKSLYSITMIRRYYVQG